MNIVFGGKLSGDTGNPFASLGLRPDCVGGPSHAESLPNCPLSLCPQVRILLSLVNAAPWNEPAAMWTMPGPVPDMLKLRLGSLHSRQ